MQVCERILGFVWGLVLLIACPVTSRSTPPFYSTFGREQRTDYSPEAAELLRVCMVYVAQGDGILIQLPTKYDYDRDPADGESERTERIDLVVDGGSNPTSEARRMTEFIRTMYEGASPIIEYVVITHHDQDHVVGITKLLGEGDIIFDTIYHNGLASYKPGKRGFPATGTPANAIFDSKSRRGMAFVNAAKEINESHLIQTLNDLRSAQTKDELQGIYKDLAEAVLERADQNHLVAFQRAHADASFITERQAQRGEHLPDIQFKVLWPLTTLKSYGGNNWGETINGNSVTFRLEYKDFSMVFTGDHNEKSEPELLNHLKAVQKLELLDCDVLKVPHHGSSHAHQQFFQRPGFEPVVAVASMGNVGFKSKQMGSGWQHPSTDIIAWLGGAHRVYHTFAQEREFSWADITTEAKRQKMIEMAHVLIETDGKWFRLVEVPVDGGNPLRPPSVVKTRRGNGTRWIRAAKN